jgi:hypothetical protein
MAVLWGREMLETSAGGNGIISMKNECQAAFWVICGSEKSG